MDEENEEDGRPAWLPENFLSPEALVRSYEHAEQKVEEQRQHLELVGVMLDTLDRRLAESQSQLAAAQEPGLEASVAQPAPEPASRRDNVFTMRELVEREAGQKPAVNPQAVRQVLEAIAARTVSEAPVPAGLAVIGQRERIISAIASDSPGAFRQAAAPVSDTHLMKINAQTMSGAGSRPDYVSDTEQSWGRIQAAGANNYAEFMANR